MTTRLLLIVSIRVEVASLETGPYERSPRSSFHGARKERLAARAWTIGKPYRRTFGVDRVAARRRRGRRSRGNEENDVRKREGKQRRSGKQIFWTEERVYTRKLIRTWRAAMEGREAASVCVVECRTADRHTIHSRPCRRFFPPSFPFFFFLSFSLSLFLSSSPFSCSLIYLSHAAIMFILFIHPLNVVSGRFGRGGRPGKRMNSQSN